MRKPLEASVYHSILRVSLVVCAIVLLFDSGLISKTTAKLSQGAQQYVATAVGVKVGVAPNEVNVLTARITELESELAKRERDIAVNLNASGGTTSGTNTSTFVLSAILFILLVLIVLNYILDYLRGRRAAPTRPVRVS
jgi:hypothetical protein